MPYDRSFAAGTDFIDRPRVDALLHTALQKSLVAVGAGAGFGKTTAISRFLAREGYRTVWFSCIAPDNNPARFWEQLIRVFSQHRPQLGDKMRSLGFPETFQRFTVFLADLTEELYFDDRAVAFVFDDVHLMTDPAVQSFLVNFIAARLENSNILLLTRVWPLFSQPLPVSPAVITASDLRFSQEETRAYFRHLGLAVDNAAADRIHDYVSGWPMALPLVAMALQRGAGAEDMPDVQALDDSKPALYALFEREIFSQYTQPERDLLVQLSVLDSFPRGLVRAVTGERGRELSELLGGNIFIGYDAQTMRLSFHPLYHEFLRDKLRGLGDSTQSEVYCRAAEWCRDNGFYHDAAIYYRRCGNHEATWQMLLQLPAVRRNRSEANALLEQIAQLPEEFKDEHPMTRIVMAAQLINNMRLDEAQGALDAVYLRLERMADSAEKEELLGEYHIARGFLTLAREQNGFEVDFERAAQLLPGGSRRWDSRLLLVDLGPGLNLQSARAGELRRSLACFTRGVPHMVKVLHGTGQGLDALCESEALFLTGEPKKAAEPAYQALYAAEAASQYDIVGNALFMLLRIYTVAGDYASVLDTLEHVQRYELDKASQNLGIWDIIRGWFYAEVGEVERVAMWIRNPVQQGFAPISIDRPLLVRLRCLIAAGQYAEALALLEQYEALAKSKGAVITLLYAALARAVTHNYLGHINDAIASLRSAYNLSKGNRLFMPFIEYGHRTRSLLERARQMNGHGIPEEWLDMIYAKASTYSKRHASLVGRYRQERDGYSIDYALSPRETQLLDNLSQGLTREEIAQVMQLSINTVKSMTKQVFAKLGAINAADAVRIGILNRLI